MPKDFELFEPGIYPSDLPFLLAPDPGWTEAERLPRVTDQLMHDIAHYPDARRERTLAVFEQAAFVMDVRIAAGLSMLVGTSGEAVIYIILNGEVSDEIIIGSVFDNDKSFNFQSHSGVTKKCIVLNEVDGHDDFRIFTAYFAHEALHSDTTNGRPEEAVAHLIQMVIMAELLVEQPDMFAAKTDLARAQATYMLSLLFNSVSAVEGRGDVLFPGGDVESTDFCTRGPIAVYVDLPTPASPLLVEILTAMGVDLDQFSEIAYTREFVEQLTVASLIDPRAGSNPGT